MDADQPASSPSARSLILFTLAAAGEPLYPSHLVEVLKLYGVRLGPRRNAVSKPKLDPILREMEQEELIVQGEGGRWELLVDGEELCWQLVAEGKLPLLRELSALLPHTVSNNLERSVRYTLYERNDQELVRLASSLVATPGFDYDYLERAYRHPVADVAKLVVLSGTLRRATAASQAILAAALVGKAAHLLEPLEALVGEDGAEAVVAALTGDPPTARARQDLVCAALLQGDLSRAQGLIEVGEVWPESQALVAFFLGDDDGAIAAFAAGQRRRRKEAGRRSKELDCSLDLGDVIYPMALARRGSDEDQAALLRFVRSASPLRSPVNMAAFRLGEVVEMLAHGPLSYDLELHTVFPSAAHGERLATLLWALTGVWLGRSLKAKDRGTLEELQGTAAEGGYRWVAAQLADVLGAAGDARRAAWAAEVHAELGTQSLLGVASQEDRWRRDLQELIHIGSSAGAGEPAEESEGSSRLAFMVTLDGHRVQAEAREQKRQKSGWSRGRKIALKRLVSQQKEFAFLDEHDRRIIACVQVERTSRYWGRYRDETWFLEGDELALALVGHPRVFWADNPATRVEVLEGRPQLLVQRAPLEEQGGAGAFSLAFVPALSSERGVVVVEESPTRLSVISLDPTQLRIAASLRRPLRAPLSAEAQIREAVAALAPHMTVQSELGGAVADAEVVQAPTTLSLQLSPRGEGLVVRVVVRPLGEKGPLFTPGLGAPQVLGEIDGPAPGERRRVQVQRDLLAEGRRVEELTTSCSLLQGLPEELYLDDSEACLELLVALAALPEEGAPVVEWPEGETLRVTPPRGAERLSLSISSDAQGWLEAKGELRVDAEQVLSFKELLERLDEVPGRFVPLSGGRYLALTELFRARLAVLAAATEVTANGRRFGLASLPALDEALAVVEDEGELTADAALGEARDRLAAARAYTPRVPRTLQAELRDYQHEGFRWLARMARWGFGACLADDMGLGKTLQTLALLLHRARGGPALVVAPTSVLMVWAEEAARFAPTLNVRRFGPGDRDEALAGLGAFDVLLCGYGLLPGELERLSARRWHTLVLDEAQAIKNPLTRRAKAARALTADFRLATTGTPLENHLGELHALFRFLEPSLLGSKKRFDERFAGPMERGAESGKGPREQLRQLVRPFILRRTKSEVLRELPPRTDVLLRVPLSAKEASFYEALRQRALERFEGDAEDGGQEQQDKQQRVQILAELMRLRRACSHGRLVDPKAPPQSAKLEAFEGLLEELLEGGHRALVFSQFVDVLSLVRERLERRGVSYQYLDGSCTEAARRESVDAFRDGEGEVFLISLRAGGFGLNLTAADYVIHLDPWWNPAVEDQAADRAHRIGQRRPVTVYRLVAADTVEERIVALQQRKRELVDGVLEGSAAAARLDVDELLALLRGGLGG